MIDKNFDLCSVDRYLVPFFGSPQSGWVDIGKNTLTRADFLYKITHSHAAVVQITMIPGETTDVFLKNVAFKLGMSYELLKKEYKKRVKYPDGVIIPESYNIPLGMSEGHFIHYLTKNSMMIHKKMSQKIFGAFDEKKWFRYITIASIIQKEAQNSKEMPLISAVIYNRLKRGMRLQMDGSLNYGLYSHTKVTKKRIKEDNSPYNTYKIKALPPYPICSVSKEAIKAAIFPSHKNYLYFVKGKDGKHIFSKSYISHKKAIKDVKYSNNKR